MPMISKRAWKRAGVSPIIATILMVAITVVLAGVLYVMVIGLQGPSGGGITPGGSWLYMTPQTNTSVKMVFGPFTKTVQPMDIQVFLENGGNRTTLSFASAPDSAETDMQVAGYHDSTIFASYTDSNWQSNTINGGDYIIVSGLTSGKVYTVSVYHIPTDAVISMTGDLNDFQLNP